MKAGVYFKGTKWSFCDVMFRFSLLAEHREEGERGRKAFLRCPRSSESREGETLGGLQGCHSACLGKTSCPPCSSSLWVPEAYTASSLGSWPIFPASGPAHSAESLGNSCHFIIVRYTYSLHLPQKKEVFKFIFRDLPNTECMFHLSKLAPSYEQTLGLEERKNEDITPPRGKMGTREETKTAALQVMVGSTVRFPQTPCHPFLWTVGVHMGF